MREPLQSFNLTEEEIMHIAHLTLSMTAHEMVAPIEHAIWLRREVREKYTLLTDTEKKTFRWKLIAQILYRAYLLALERAGKADDKIPETLME
jgi:hypothetical protein